MSTTMAKKEAIVRGWYVIDAAGKTLGNVAVAAATVLNGKHRPEYTPHVDCGECVVVINAEKIVLTGKKLDQKMYYHHTGYVGGLKSVKYRTLMATEPKWLLSLPSRECFPRTKSVLQASADSRFTEAPNTNSRHRSPSFWK